MTISVLNGGGIVTRGGTFFRVLLVLAIIVQGSLFAHDAHHPASRSQVTAITSNN